MGTNVVSSASAINIVALSSALLIGFVIGISVTARRGKQQQQQQPHQEKRQQPRGGTKRRARIRKSEDNAKAKAAGLKPPLSPVEGHAKHLSRRTRKHVKKPSSKDLALDAFVRVARSHIDCIGAGDYGSLLLLPREAFLDASRFVPYADCLEHLVTLGQARANTPGLSELRVLYVSCSWTFSGGAPGDWTTKDFETTRAFLQRNSDLEYVYVGRSCVTSNTDDPVRTSQLRHVPCALMRADAVLVLLRASDVADHGEDSPSSKRQRHSDFKSHARDAWVRMELALAAVGQADVFVAFRAEPFAEAVCELAPGKSDVGEMVEHAATALRVAAAAARVGVANSTADGNGFHGSARIVGSTEGKDAENVAAKVKAACKNWLEAELNPLAALEAARAIVTAAEKSGDVDSLDSIRGMRRPIPTTELTKAARESLGDERVEGARELALSLLLFTVLCSKPKEPATYTDAFVDDAGKKEVRYRPVAVVRSPYRERFGTPRQPQVTASVLHGGAQEGQIVFLKGHGYEEALHDLSGFDMIWVISHMHLNKGWNRKVRPPRLPEERKGLFSTRSPHRPNPVALSSLRVSRVDATNGVIYVHGLDLLDGTPVLDVKPYIGYCDAFPDMKAGWLDALGSDHEAQGDFLPKFSVGATLVHTVTRTKGTDGSSTNALSSKPAEEGGEDIP